jgi:dihydrofolate reductase
MVVLVVAGAIDGYGAGPDQDLANPMGVGGMALHLWVFGTKTFQKMAADFAGSLIGDEVGRQGVDDDFAARGFENIGAWIMGRNMFGPARGPWLENQASSACSRNGAELEHAFQSPRV